MVDLNVLFKVHSKINKARCAEDYVFAPSFNTLFVTQQKITFFTS